MALHDLNRAQDTPSSVLKLADIVPDDFPTLPSPISAAMTTQAYQPVYTWNGGVYGDDQILAKTNVLVDDRGIGDYTPRNQDDKAKLPGASPPNAIAGEPDFTIVTDITAPRGYIAPRDPYSKAEPAAPVVSSLAPNTAIAGSPSPLSVVVTGTGFTPFTILIVGNIQTPYVTYVSSTKLVLTMDPARSTVGVVTVFAVDHSVQSAPVNFTYT